ncbi:hypothetical protein GCM10011384_13110 [Psychrobacillus lasiicapitis]|nr:hypothetical protein GCM10011384_13110 [Psychrobacillus lasiicapitis]
MLACSYNARMQDFIARIGEKYERIWCSNARVFFYARIGEIYERIQQSNARMIF